MAAWRGPFRSLTRWFRRQRAWPEKSPITYVHRQLDPVISDGLVGAVLSIVPGLAHLLKGRFREVALYVALWFLVLSAGLFLYGSTVGSLLIGLAIGLHAWIALQYGLFKNVTQLVERMVLVLMTVAALAGVYWLAPRVIPPHLVGARTALTIPAMDVHAGDFFLARPLTEQARPLSRGVLVVIEPRAFRNNYRNRQVNRRNMTIGQVVGLPGETVRVLGTAFIVDGHPLDNGRYPVPRWLQGGTRGSVLGSGVHVPHDSYFVTSEYTVYQHGRVTLTNEMVGNVCIMGFSDIRGRAFLHWWPLSRRGFIEYQ